MRRFSKLMLVAAILSALFVILPGAFAASATIAGDVTGLVTYSGTELPLSGGTAECSSIGAHQSYTFGGVIINGAISGGGQTYVGSIGTTNVKGQSYSNNTPGSGCETLSGGAGWVNPPNSLGQVVDPGHFTGSAGPESVSGDFSGTYVRQNSIVTVTLTVTNLKINNVSIGGNVPVKVIAQFTPNSFNTATGAVKGAVFAGSFENVT
ncbi:MAG: hypothetical protein LC723_01180 [Actinobacteria bacterium]|nr:hypothetical protein [Actinomycetota bacterium]